MKIKNLVYLSLSIIFCVACTTPLNKNIYSKSQNPKNYLLINNIERTWDINLPINYRDDVNWPLVFEFHGSGSSPTEQAKISGLRAIAEEEGFILVRPKAAYYRPNSEYVTWNVDLHDSDIDDVLFVQELIKYLSAQYSIDSSRIYATGFSGGGRMSSRIACDLSEQIAAIAPVGGIRFPENCAASRSIPVLTFHGILDMVNHYELQNDSPPYWRMGVEEALSGWIENNKCNINPINESVSESTNKRVYQDCVANSEIHFYLTTDAGHTWPGSNQEEFFTEIGLGKTEKAINASELIWEFFSEFNLKK